MFNRSKLSTRSFYQAGEGLVGGLVTERFCRMEGAEEAAKLGESFVLPNTDIKGWDVNLPGVDQGFFAYVNVYRDHNCLVDCLSC